MGRAGQDDLIEGVIKGNMELQGDWTVYADKIMVFNGCYEHIYGSPY